MSNSRRRKSAGKAFLPPPGLEARRFGVGEDEYVLLSFPWPAAALPDSLTPAEADVARRATEGQSIDEIASARDTSVHTVANQLRSVYAKLGISSRAELVRACRRQAPELVLRAVVESDLELFFEDQRDPEAVAMVAFASRDREAHVAHWRKILANPSGLARTIVVDGVVAGNLVTWSDDGHREVGYWISKRYWGRGIATRALAMFVELIEERPIQAWVAEHNRGSIRVLEKCGFARAEKQPEPAPGKVRYVVMERVT
jgi:RimJ/RimL family protein N-acetyltransferase